MLLFKVIFFLFLFDFCSLQGHRPAICTDNVTEQSDKDLHSGEANYVETFICQSTIIPSDGRGFRTAFASQSLSLADTFLGRLVTGFYRYTILENNSDIKSSLFNYNDAKQYKHCNRDINYNSQCTNVFVHSLVLVVQKLSSNSHNQMWKT